MHAKQKCRTLSAAHHIFEKTMQNTPAGTFLKTTLKTRPCHSESRNDPGCPAQTLSTPLGDMTLWVKNDTATRLTLPSSAGHRNDNYLKKTTLNKKTAPHLSFFQAALAAYFQGDFGGLKSVFPAMKQHIQNLSTPFQRRVWMGLLDIPPGKTWSYQELAQHVGAHKAYRAVGNANAANPFPILIPCHRVIQKNGSLGGYQGKPWQASSLKQWLLNHEKHALQHSVQKD